MGGGPLTAETAGDLVIWAGLHLCVWSPPGPQSCSLSDVMLTLQSKLHFLSTQPYTQWEQSRAFWGAP